MTLLEMTEVAKRGGFVKWSDGTITKITLEDSHLFGMVMAVHRNNGMDILELDNNYDAEIYEP